ncbi:carbon-nitrogen hydrolase [Tuber magnatum]|uniref:Carbon-nitrogen hydrolase n=1 Tax=Tuber magnatum TaxID=42249 RepID=A0A317SUU0_9PEZI|nr:carbon-nitrogen hydrolase [Tuber magnatum]
MRIACLQFNPQLGNIAHNLRRADTIISRAGARGIDLLILPEMAFSGYKFGSVNEINSHLEPTAAGPSTVWARSIARRLGCYIALGYPEHCAHPPSSPSGPMSRYNSAVLVSPGGDVLVNYRKHFLFSTDESWAEEGPDGFFSGDLPDGLGRLAMGICMDLNPRRFEAPFEKYEFAHHILDSKADIAVMPMAWLTSQPAESLVAQAQVPDADTLAYWIQRLQPILDKGGQGQSGETIFVACNRTGTERNACYAGTSAVVGVSKGNAKIYGHLGRGTEDLLVCDVPGPGRNQATE